MDFPKFGCAPRAYFAAAAAMIVLVGAAGCTKSEAPSAAAPPPASAASAPAATPASAKAAPATDAPEAVKKLMGRWMRADGGYVLELRKAEISGVVEAAYFNPNPIKVSRAMWMQGGSGLQIMVELNDVGYPGATYVLSHDAQTDRLVGQYTQPAMQQSFDIEFMRQPKQ
jgi:hypothetical protein